MTNAARSVMLLLVILVYLISTTYILKTLFTPLRGVICNQGLLLQDDGYLPHDPQD